jgi:hypothetical protein
LKYEDIGSIKIQAPSPEKGVVNMLTYAVLQNNAFAAQELVNLKHTFKHNDATKLFFFIRKAYFTKELILDVLKACGAVDEFINHRNEDKLTPLMAAAHFRNYGAVLALGSVPGALFTLQDSNGNTCLHYASGQQSVDAKGTLKDAEEIIKYLIGVHPELVDIKNNDGLGPGNPKWVGPNLKFRELIKAKKLTFSKHPNTEKTARNALSQGKGGRKTRRRRRAASGKKTARL